jgi:putative Ca2+/H+ antiporter (TMEM165/GDT1 family)
MPSFLFAFVAVLLVSIGARDQLLVARLTQVLGRRASLLLLACTSVAAISALMAWAGHAIAALVPPSGKAMLVAIALFMAAVELFWPNREKTPKEPTRSLFAFGLVILARQLGDAARFLVFALAVATGVPWLAGAGGALGGCAALALGWVMAGELEAKWPLRAIRIVLGTVILLAALFIGLSARGIVR